MDFFSKFKNFKKEKTPPPPPPPPTPIQEIVREPVSEVRKPIEEIPPLQEEIEVPVIESVSQMEPVELGLTEFDIDDLLRKLVELGGSDLHLESGAPPVYRIKGDIRFSSMPPLTNQQVQSILMPIMPDREKKVFDRVGNLDYAHEIPDLARFRVNFLRQHHGIGAVFRVIPTKIPTVEQLNLPQILKKIAMTNRGIVIVTGPTGSGKSTTMASMINHVNHNRKAHIITIEDPIEFTHPSIQCLIDHREVGHHTRSFPEALKAALREDPDIILVGEMRDLETISLAMTAAEMGVLVFGTLHTNSAPKTIDRIIDVFPSKQQDQARSQLSQSLKAIIAQQLMKTADGKGRIAAIEILLCNLGISNLIREGKTTQLPSFIQMGKDEGMQSMDAALIELAKAGKISPATAYERASEKSRLQAAGIPQPRERV